MGHLKCYSTHRARLSVSETLDLPVRLLLVAPIRILVNVLRGVCLAWRRGLPLGYYFTCALIRVALTAFAPRQIQLLSPTTTQTYRSWIAHRSAAAQRSGDNFLAQRLKEDIEPLPDGRSCIMWVGDRQKARRFVLFFHGGGYIASLTPGHLEWCLQAYLLATKKVEVAVAVLEYTLCPAAQYPVQLKQAAAALAHLFASGIDPGHIIVGGDSAGANLTTQLLGHILHPNPRVDPVVQLNKPLLAAFTVSPWVSTRVEGASFIDNRNIDMLAPSLVASSCRRLLDGTGYNAEQAEGKGWGMAADVHDSWFEGFGHATRSLYVTVGRHEILRDQGIVFAESVRRRNRNVQVHVEVGESEAHDFILVEGMKRTVGDATLRMRTWFSSIVQAPRSPQVENPNILCPASDI